MYFKIKLADVIIGINSLNDEVYNMCRNYISAEDEDFSIAISQSDIDFEREKSKREAAFEGIPVNDYSDAYLETLAVYRKIVVSLLDYGVFLMHGSAVCANGEAYIFTARSGVGKTTHSRLWLENISGSFIINGDKPLIKVTDSGCTVFGTPWSGKEGLNENTYAPIKAVCFLERGAENRIAEVRFSDVFPLMLQQTYRPDDAQAMVKTLNLVKEAGARIRFYRLACNMEAQAALVAYEGMNKC